MARSERIALYVEKWRGQGYPDDIPDEVPDRLMQLGLAPSYKTIAIAILKNDNHFVSLGFSAPESHWYGVLKRIELEERLNENPQHLQRNRLLQIVS